MMARAIVFFGVLTVIVVALYAFVLVPNYRECRSTGHSAMYCTTTHLIR